MSARSTSPGIAATAVRKKQRRGVQNLLIASLDQALPDIARSKAFKGAGPRSAGIRGRSIFNVLTDVIGHIKETHLQAASILADKQRGGALREHCVSKRAWEKDSEVPCQMTIPEQRGAGAGDAGGILEAANVLESLHLALLVQQATPNYQPPKHKKAKRASAGADRTKIDTASKRDASDHRICTVHQMPAWYQEPSATSTTRRSDTANKSEAAHKRDAAKKRGTLKYIDSEAQLQGTFSHQSHGSCTQHMPAVYKDLGARDVGNMSAHVVHRGPVGGVVVNTGAHVLPFPVHTQHHDPGAGDGGSMVAHMPQIHLHKHHKPSIEDVGNRGAHVHPMHVRMVHQEPSTVDGGNMGARLSAMQQGACARTIHAEPSGGDLTNICTGTTELWSRTLSSGGSWHWQRVWVGMETAPPVSAPPVSAPPVSTQPPSLPPPTNSHSISEALQAERFVHPLPASAFAAPCPSTARRVPALRPLPYGASNSSYAPTAAADTMSRTDVRSIMALALASQHAYRDTAVECLRQDAPVMLAAPANHHLLNAHAHQAGSIVHALLQRSHHAAHFAGCTI